MPTTAVAVERVAPASVRYRPVVCVASGPRAGRESAGGTTREQRREYMKTGVHILIGCFVASAVAGCSDPREQFGRTWYLDGAGNWGFGALDVPVGLEEAGYKGFVTNHRWSLTFNPALDQTLRFIAKGQGAVLGDQITDYLKRHPGAEANVIALSAGTGVAMWAIENVKPPHKVNNYILVGSSISSRYDTRKALKNMKGDIIVYYCSRDPVLQGPVRALGTIDGTFDDSAGLVGLRGTGSSSGRIKNIAWNSKFVKLGWTGGHADCVNKRFVKGELKRWIVSPSDRTHRADRSDGVPPPLRDERREVTLDWAPHPLRSEGWGMSLAQAGGTPLPFSQGYNGAPTAQVPPALVPSERLTDYAR